MVSRQKAQEQLDALVALIARHPGGISVDDIVTGMGISISHRTLQRRLAALVEQGRIETTGLTRALRYRVKSAGQGPVAKVPAETQQTPAEIPLSDAAKDILALVSRPVRARQPVGYERAFLDAYQPNVTTYLTNAEKARLRDISKTRAPDERAGTYAKHILNRLLIDLSFNSSRLEGNTYSLLDTERLIEHGEAAEGKNATEAQMILNHKAAIEFLVESAEDVGFDRRTILNLHALLSENLLADPNAEGRLRQLAVRIGQSVYHPLAVPQLIDECFNQILQTAAAIEDPFEQAFFVMVHMPYLQPFEDVNKRVSRLAANIPFIKGNLSPLSFIDVPDDLYIRGLLGVYELNRVDLLKDVFLWAYERSSARYAAVRKTLGEPDPFRLRHRSAIKQVVADVIRGKMTKKLAAVHVAAFAKRLPEGDRARFVEAAESELLALHDGNFARYQVTPDEFAAWQAVWNRKPVVRGKKK